MKLNIGQVLASEKFVLSFECEKDFSSLEMGDGVRPFGRVQVKGTVRNRYQGIAIEATISAHAVAPCARCLGDVAFDVNVPLECFIGPDGVGDDLVNIEGGHVIDLSTAVEEALFDEYPSKLLCSPECKGLCPVCGQDLNHGSCDHTA